MHDQEAIEMMCRSSNEIKNLRAVIDRLQPKADAYDNIASLLALLPKQSQAYGEDVAWMLDKRVKEIEASMLKEKEHGNSDEDGGSESSA